MPAVPNVPGVPPLTSYLATTIVLLAADVIPFLGIGTAPQWGLFKNGEPVVEAESVNTFEYTQEWHVANYPIEQGGFESYDKVYTPFEVRIRFTSGGSEINRQILLDSIAAIAGDLNLYDAVTPEAVYQGVNVTRYDYSRAATRGLGIMVVDVHLVQVNVSGQAAFSNTKSPNAQSPQSTGQVQTTPASSAQTGTLFGSPSTTYGPGVN